MSLSQRPSLHTIYQAAAPATASQMLFVCIANRVKLLSLLHALQYRPKALLAIQSSALPRLLHASRRKPC